jgi:hypothetical protein
MLRVKWAELIDDVGMFGKSGPFGFVSQPHEIGCRSGRILIWERGKSARAIMIGAKA